MKVIKRNGKQCDFDKTKIVNAVLGAMKDVNHVDRNIAENIADTISKIKKDSLEVEEIQNLVEDELMNTSLKDVAKAYIRFRYKKELIRGNTTDESIFELLSGTSEYWNKENSNKNAKVVTVQRDYISGITSTDIAKRFLLPKDVLEAHEAGIIHQHDMDYMAQNALHNCSLINLDDMLQNGTVVNDVQIDPQNRLLTATTVATQIITAVCSSQYGGTTITLSHLAPFVRKSFYKHFKSGIKYITETIYEDGYQKQLLDNISKDMRIDDEHYKEYPETYQYAMDMLKREIKDSVQTFNYQINSMSTTNGKITGALPL